MFVKLMTESVVIPSNINKILFTEQNMTFTWVKFYVITSKPRK